MYFSKYCGIVLMSDLFILLFQLFPNEIVVFAAVEQIDYPAFGVPLKHLFATPDAFLIKSVFVQLKQFFFSAPRPLTEKFVAFARDSVNHFWRQLILADVFVQFFRADGDWFALVRD